jgi:ABC-2 type transport system permease protein
MRSALRQHLGVSLRLHFRNRMALLYGYLFPLIFLVAFWVLYRHERIPLAWHMGELLTVTVLGGACFGLPTTMVSERERGVWRRYRLAPVSTRSLIGSTVLARYFILITAGLLQLALAMALGMPFPAHPVDLWLAFTFVSFAFLGLGLVMAMMADNVPAVQALGQCIFLPMLIIGGVAVPLASLPAWAQHLSAFFPGRYAVEALQAAVTGDGLGVARFDVLALVLIGAAGCTAGTRMFRWDAQQRFASGDGKAWAALALAAWAGVGALAESRGRISTTDRTSAAPSALTEIRSDAPAPSTTGAGAPAPAAPTAPGSTASAPGGSASVPPASMPSTPVPSGSAPLPSAPAASSAGTEARPPAGPAPPKTEAPPEARTPPATASGSAPASWQAVTLADIDRDLVFDRLPADDGVVAPIAALDEEPPPGVLEELDFIRNALPDWRPGKVDDRVQRVRNYLLVAAVPDVLQISLERYLPVVVFERLQEDLPKEQLIQILYWIALHPFEGDDAAVDQLWALHVGDRPPDMSQVRERVAFYAVKLLGRLTGKIKSR